MTVGRLHLITKITHESWSLLLIIIISYESSWLLPNYHDYSWQLVAITQLPWLLMKNGVLLLITIITHEVGRYYHDYSWQLIVITQLPWLLMK